MCFQAVATWDKILPKKYRCCSALFYRPIGTCPEGKGNAAGTQPLPAHTVGAPPASVCVDSPLSALQDPRDNHFSLNVLKQVTQKAQADFPLNLKLALVSR